nr:hypothetical protein [Tanacetum cinerariifolium]
NALVVIIGELEPYHLKEFDGDRSGVL